MNSCKSFWRASMVWVAYEPYSKKILGFWLSRTRNSYEAELFLRSLVKLIWLRELIWSWRFENLMKKSDFANY